MTGRNKADGTNELEERLNQYIVSERNKAICDLADEEQISSEVLNLYIKEYDYLQKEQPEIIQKALKEKHLGLIKTRKALTRILDRLRGIIRTLVGIEVMLDSKTNKVFFSACFTQTYRKCKSLSWKL